MARTRKPDTEASASREDRLGAALRANLARRKEQARARASGVEEQQGKEPSTGQAPESEE